jgi:PAS domain S-box-containing protein
MRFFLAERNLQIEKSDEKYRSIIDNSLEGIFQSTSDGTLLTINQTFSDILGYSDSAELMQLNIKELYVDEVDRNKLLREILEKGKVENYRVRLKKRDGSIAIVRLNDRVVKDEAGNIYFEGNIYDITEQVKVEEEKQLVAKMLQKEKEKNEKLAQEAIRISGTKSKFLANLSHEIRTPINGILGFLSLIEAGAYSNEEELKFFSTNARQSAESLLDIINSILDLSKIEAGKAKVENVRFNLINVIDQSISVISFKANEKNIRIIKEIPDSIESQVIGDMVKLRQIVINLLTNAVKFTSDGEIRIAVSAQKINNSDVEVSFSVTDTGIGIPESKIKELFKPYSQLGDFYESFAHGTGLGLVITKEYVELLGGKINVTSREGEGSSFNFTIICKVQTAHDVMTESQTEKETFETQFLGSIENFRGNGFKKKRERFKILLAEDNLINQKVTMKILNTFGFNVSAVSDGLEAVNALSNDSYDLVLMDLQMPNVDGFAATEKIRAFPNSKRNIPIIALTAHALMGDREKCLDAGMTDYISKPVSGQELVKKIDVLLDIRKDDARNKESVSSEISPKLDKDRLKNVSLGDKEFEKDLLMSFLSDLDDKYKYLIELLADHDLAKIVEIVHSIKGSSYSIGAVKVGEEAYAIELSGKNNDWVNINARIEKFDKTIQETKEEIKNYINRN